MNEFLKCIAPIVAVVRQVIARLVEIAAAHPMATAIVVAGAALFWLIHCTVYPSRNCLHCHGTGRFQRKWFWFVTCMSIAAV